MSQTIITYGTFDLFHIGHLRILERARALGDKLIVGLSTDEFNGIKGKRSVFSFEERRHILNGIRYVDLVIPEATWDQKPNDIKTYGVTTFVMGHDWEGKFDHLKSLCAVVYLPRTDGVSTTYIKHLLAQGGVASKS